MRQTSDEDGLLLLVHTPERCSLRREGETCWIEPCEAAVELTPAPDGCRISRHHHNRADEVDGWLTGRIYAHDNVQEYSFCSPLCRDILLRMAMDYAKSEGIVVRVEPEPAEG